MSQDLYPFSERKHVFRLPSTTNRPKANTSLQPASFFQPSKLPVEDALLSSLRQDSGCCIVSESAVMKEPIQKVCVYCLSQPLMRRKLKQ